MLKFIRLVVPVSLAGTFMASCGGNHSGGGQWNAGGPQPFPVIAVAQSNADLYEDYPAMLEGQENVEIRPKVDGFIKRIYVDEGADVKQGQLLFTLHAPQYEQEVRTAGAAVKSAEAALNAAKLQLRKAQPLAEKGIVNQFEVDEARYNVQAKEAALVQAQAGLENAKVNVGYTAVTSPINGVIGSLPYKTGSLVSSSAPQPLTTVSNIKRLYAYFSIDEKRFLELAESGEGAGMKDKIKDFPPVTLILANGKEYGEKGRLETVSGLINTATGSASFRAGFNNPGARIRSGSSATVRIQQKLEQAIVIPQSATYELQDKRFVYVVSKEGVVKSRQIEVNPFSIDRNFVVQSGLAAGENIVSDGMGNLKDGMKIIPTDPSKMGAPPAH